MLLLFLLPGCREPDGPGRRPGADPTHDTQVASPQAAPWLRDEVQAPGSVTFSELLYHPAGQEDLEWLELHNPMALDMDLSGWSLEGGVSFDFVEGTVLPAGGYLVVAADPALLQEETDFAQALGPYLGRLSDGGERVQLRSNGGRLIDTLDYGDDEPWPVAADGSGLSLAKVAPAAASDHAESWTVSAQGGGTPGAPNHLDPDARPTLRVLVDHDATWSFDLSGDYPSPDWAEPDYDDSGWSSGEAPFFVGGGEELLAATAWATADNYFALYLGNQQGGELRLVGEDSDGSWTTVEEMDFEVGPGEHLYLAAWELTGDSTSPQMTIAEVELPEEVVGTDASAFEWVLGPSFSNPGGLPQTEPPSTEELAGLIGQANADSSWELPAVEAVRSASPWGGTVSWAFSEASLFIWGDTFNNDSVTNSEDTYALFRSIEPLLAPRGNMELSELPTTITFRTPFLFEGSPSSTELFLDCAVDDGAVIHLNGVEVHRENMPEGDLDATTLASSEVDEALELFARISGEPLIQGLNVLAVEVHQAQLEDLDMSLGCELTARSWTRPPERTVVLNEVVLNEVDSFLELLNLSPSTQDLSGLLLRSSSGAEARLVDLDLEPGELLLVEDLGLEPGDRLFLYSADGTALLDAVRVDERPRARADQGGPWLFPSETSPGEANLFELSKDVVINEIQFHRAPRSVQGEPITPRDEEWIELYNRGQVEVDLSGWRMVDAVAFEFPEGTVLAAQDYLVVAKDAQALRLQVPGVPVVGDFAGRLDNDSDRILLLDAVGNPADEVRYFDGGRWPEAADGGGASLELRDPWADNASAEAWAASEQSGEWVWTTLRGVAEPSVVGPDGTWEELVLGLLDAGEVLIDDVSVVQDPDTAPVELVRDGAFEDPQSWRVLGNHGRSEVVPDPDDPSNPVLRIVATGATGHMHNHVESTLLAPLGSAEVELRFRARWVSGSNQLHTRLYFNRLPRTTLVEQPEASGTPGEENSTRQDNLGPTFQDFGQDVAVPRPFEPVLVSVTADDPDGVEALTLFSSVDDGAFQEQAMVQAGEGRWEAEVEGHPAGSILQLYVQGQDALGATSTFPAGGPDSRALYVVDDGQAASNGLHNLRILMTSADSDWLHEETNLMSNGRVGATVVYNEAELFYDVGVRLKGSERGRPTQPRVGYGVRFQREQPFRGSHTSVLIDRSEGVGFGQREVLLNLVATRAGLVSGEHNDLIHLMAPRSQYNGSAELQLDRFSNLVLASQFVDGDRGTRFEYELIYYPTSTDDGSPEGLKLPQPDRVIGTAITDLGEDKEAYRWNFLIKNNLRQDDYSELMELCQSFSLSGQAWLDGAEAVIDVEQWLRSFAFATLSGATDQYGGAGSQHNAQLYVRPEDRRVLYFPHDLDFFSSSSMPVVGNGDLAKLLGDPVNARSYYGHLEDILSRAYNSDYLGPWCDQLGELLAGQDFDAHCSFVDARAEWVMSGASDSVMSRFPAVDFHITTEGGEDFTVSHEEVQLEGEAWVDVRQIRLGSQPLDITWLDDSRWRVTVSLDEGDNTLTLTAADLNGEVVGTDSIVVTSDGG